MKKHIFAVILASMMGMMLNPELLAASDKVEVTGVAGLGIVQAITGVNQPFEIGDSADVNGATSVASTDNVNGATSVATPKTLNQTVNATPVNATRTAVVTEAAQSVAQTVADNIQIAGKTLAIENVANTTVDSAGHVNAIGKLLYGHNSGAVFGGLQYLSVGSTFTVTRNNVTTTYRIASMTTYEKSELSTMEARCNYKSLMQLIRDKAMGHDVALMTCAGTVFSDGDATHRLVILADSI